MRRLWEAATAAISAWLDPTCPFGAYPASGCRGCLYDRRHGSEREDHGPDSVRGMP